MTVWQKFFEQVAVPVSGLVLIFVAALGGPVPTGLYPVLGGMLVFPVARAADRKRRNGNGNNKSKSE